MENTALTEKTRTILSQKLNFTEDQIGLLEGNPPLQQEALNLIDIFRLSSAGTEVRRYAHVQFKRIRQTLSEERPDPLDVLRQARSDYYSFKRIT